MGMGNFNIKLFLVTVVLAMLCKMYMVLDHSNTVIMCSNPTQAWM
jgi:hypothetical protein